MKISIGQLKSLIFEALAPAPVKRAAQLVHATFDLASDYVDSVVAGSPDRSKAKNLVDLVDQASSMSKWMSSHREPVSPLLTRFVQVAKEIADDVGFWSRPSFFGRQEYVEKLKQKLVRLQSAELDVLRRVN